ncbi:hypothetical protein P3S68_001156 [Capsicum galapagoense]
MEKKLLTVFYLAILLIFSCDMVIGQRPKCETTDDCNQQDCEWGIAVQFRKCCDGECYCVNYRNPCPHQSRGGSGRKVIS